MSYPRTVKLFTPWARAMVEGATVDKPDYGKKTKQFGTSSRRAGTKKRRRRRKKRKNGSKD